MFAIRNHFVEYSPYAYQNKKYTNDMAHLHKELNWLSSRLTLQRVVLVSALIIGYMTFVMEEEQRDWKDKFDLKFNSKAYGNLDDSSGEGTFGIDDN